MEQSWAALVPILGDGVVRLRAHTEADLTGLTSMCQDPEMARWTTVPQPYAPSDARYYFDEVIAPGWLHNNQWSWALEAELDGEPRFAGNIDLRLDGLGGAEVGFATHPDARGLGLMTRALRLVADHALTQGLTVVRWRALVGNWGSRKIAMRCGFHFEGTLRRLLPQRGELQDAWVASLLASDDRTPRDWPKQVTLAGTTSGGEAIVLREFTLRDAPRIVEAANDPTTAHFLPLPRPYGTAEAEEYLNLAAEKWAAGTSAVWCISTPDGQTLGSIELMLLDSPASRREVGYWLHPDARGRGVATTAVRILTDHAFRAGLAHSILLQAAATNEASLAIAQRNAFRSLGVWPDALVLDDGTRTDLVMYAATLRDWCADAGRPVSPES